MNYLLNILANTSVIPSLLIFIGGIILSALGILVARKFGIQFINTTETIVSLIKNTLASLGIDYEMLNTVTDLLSKAIVYALTINAENSTSNKIKDAIEFIQKVSAELGVTLTDTEIKIYTTALSLVFSFIDSINVKTTKINYKEMIKYI